jgi:hypothetical protein
MPQPMVPTRSAREFERVSRSLQLTVGAVLAGVGLALINMVLYTSNSFAQAAPPSVPDLPLGSLKTVSVKEPPNLGDFVADKQTAIALGKAFFWDMQMGSDGLTACATCHYQAGADVRSKNTLNPGMAGGDTRFQLGGPNYQLTGGDFPFHRFTEPWNNQSPVASDNNDVVGATGVFGSVFKLPGAPGALTRGQDACTQISGDAPFAVGSINTRRVTGRNAPSAINAAYSFRNFWDGRANNNFNGFNPFGDRDPNLSNPNVKSGIWVSAANNTLTQVKISIPYSSLASQAVGPPGSPFEIVVRWPHLPEHGPQDADRGAARPTARRCQRWCAWRPGQQSAQTGWQGTEHDLCGHDPEGVQAPVLEFQVDHHHRRQFACHVEHVDERHLQARRARESNAATEGRGPEADHDPDQPVQPD